MNIREIQKINLNTHWLSCTREGEFRAIEKDPVVVRWLKHLVQYLFCCCIDVYGHIRIRRIAKQFWKDFKAEYKGKDLCKRSYIKVIDNLLDADSNPIKTYRKELQNLKKRIENRSAPQPDVSPPSDKTNSVRRKLNFDNIDNTDEIV